MQSGAEIRKSSEVQVWRGVYYDPSKKPIENGLLDRHMVHLTLSLVICSRIPNPSNPSPAIIYLTSV